MNKCSKCGKEMDDLEVKLEACIEDGKVFCKKCCEEKKSPPKKEKKEGKENDDDDSISPLGEDGKENKTKTFLTNENKNKTTYWVLGIGAVIILAGLAGYFWWKGNKRKEEEK